MDALDKTSESKGVRYTGISVLLTSVCQIGITIYLANVADAEVIGSIAICIILYSILESFSEVGFSAGLIQRRSLSKAILRSVFTYSSILVLVCSVLLMSLFFILFEDNDYLGLLFLMLLINQIGGISKTLLKKNKRFEVLAKCEIYYNTMFFTSFVSTSWFFENYVYIYIVTRLLSLFCYNVMLYFSGTEYYRFQIIGKKSFKAAYWFIRFGSYQFSSMTLNMLGKNIDQLLILNFAGKEVLGLYKVISDFLVLPTSKVNSIFNNVYHPILASLNSKRNFQNKLVSLIENASFVTLPILFGIYVLKDILPNTLLSTEWDDTTYIFSSLLIVAVVRAIGNPLGVMLLALGKVKLGFKWNLLTLCIQSIICSLFGMLYGTDGIIGGVALSSIIIHILTYNILIKSSLELSFVQYIFIPLRTLVCCMLMAFICLTLQRLFTYNAWGMLISQVIIGIVIYIISSTIINSKTLKNVIYLFK